MTDRAGYNGVQMMLAVLGGAAVGAAIALLTAPATGAKTRASIGKYIDKGRDRVNDYVESSKEKVGELVETGRDKVRGFPTAVKSGAGAFADAMREA